MQVFICIIIIISICRTLQFHVEWTNIGNFRIENVQSQVLLKADILSESNVYWTVHHCKSWGIKNQLDVTCYLYFTYYLLNMFRTLVCPSSGAYDCVDGLPHRLSCSVKTDVFAISVTLWCVMVRLVWCAMLPWHITPNAPLHTIKLH